MQNMAEECQTVQQYVNLLFDELPPALLSNSQQGSILQRQITNYGRKIMQLSQQSTYKYRNEHFLPRKQIQEELAHIYRLVIGQESHQSYQKLVRTLIQRLQWDRKSIVFKHSLPQSRLIPPTQPRFTEYERKQVLQEEKNSIKVSRAKSKQNGPRSSTVKEVLQLKGFFQKEQTSIRQFYDKVIKHLEVHKVPISSLQPQNLKFSRALDENNCQKLTDVVKNTSENHTKNINNLSHLVQLLHDNLNKRLRNEGVSNAKLQAYFYEAKRMEEVYSYTLSKMLQNLSSMRNLLPKDPTLCMTHIQTLQEISRKLYGLFPSSQSMQQLSVPVNAIRDSRSFGVQVNSSLRTVNQKKIGSETFRLQIRMTELIDKFEKNMKFRKSVEPKQVQKFFEVLKELMPVPKNMTNSEIDYQEQFRRLTELQEKRQKELNQATLKKTKKLQKKIQELQQSNQEQKKEIIKLQEQWQQQKKKLLKKIDNQQSEYKKLATQKTHLEGNINEMLKQIENMREAVKRQGNQQTFRRMQLQKERQQLKQKHEVSLKKFNESLQEFNLQRDRINQQRSVYKQKIQLVQSQLDDERELSTGLRIQLQNIVKEHSKLREQLSEMSRIYEQKIKEVEEMIGNLRQLQEIKHTQQINISKLTKNLESTNQRILSQHKDIEQYLLKIDQVSKQNTSLKAEVQHWKQQGKLTDGDLRALKDEVQKVNTAYLESEELLQSLRLELNHSNEQKEKMFKEKLKLCRMTEQLQSQINSLRTRLQAIQLSERDMKDQFYQKCQQNALFGRQLQDLKRQISKLRRQLSEQREEKSKIDKELRQIRQQSQSKRQADCADQGKRRLQYQNLRVELRKKTEQLQKQRQSYQERLGVMTQRIKQMQESSGQKMLLSRLLQHQTN